MLGAVRHSERLVARRSPEVAVVLRSLGKVEAGHRIRHEEGQESHSLVEEAHHNLAEEEAHHSLAVEGEHRSLGVVEVGRKADMNCAMVEERHIDLVVGNPGAAGVGRIGHIGWEGLL